MKAKDKVKLVGSRITGKVLAIGDKRINHFGINRTATMVTVKHDGEDITRDYMQDELRKVD